ncbi:FitA-like ribbon-helix-helix domain-containing protein [Glycomyces xiaoerkulensis]|uniref:FitA-like ribbon-helix-helix domain-containing protein n=1 Tax=Glycomyces xiaoerkulensis TaxID=2038139 RepID=UPI0038CC0ECE
MSIRGIDPAVYESIRVRAANHGQSMEAEVREILTRAADDDLYRRPMMLGALMRSFVAETGGVDLELPDRSETDRELDLSLRAGTPRNEQGSGRAAAGPIRALETYLIFWPALRRRWQARTMRSVMPASASLP